MREVIATAIRIEDTVQVTIHSFLRNNTWIASVTGTYPVDVVHIKDPGHAEVYLEEHETRERQNSRVNEITNMSNGLGKFTYEKLATVPGKDKEFD